MTMAKAISVSEFEPGQYSLLVKVTDNLTKDVIAQSDNFTVR